MVEIAESESSQSSEEARVVEFLRRHPDLLNRHPELLETLELSHASGSAVSLIERQVEVLRGKNGRLEDRMSRLLETARDNERRANAVQKLARALIRAPSLAAVVAALRQSMREDFAVDAVFIGLTLRSFRRHDIDGIIPLEPGHRILQIYENFFRTRLIECGPISAETSALLFPRALEPLKSAAAVPLDKEKTLGMIVLGARQPERFVPRQGKLFLEMVADLAATAIRTRLQ